MVKIWCHRPVNFESSVPQSLWVPKPLEREIACGKVPSRFESLSAKTRPCLISDSLCNIFELGRFCVLNLTFGGKIISRINKVFPNIILCKRVRRCTSKICLSKLCTDSGKSSNLMISLIVISISARWQRNKAEECASLTLVLESRTGKSSMICVCACVCTTFNSKSSITEATISEKVIQKPHQLDKRLVDLNESIVHFLS